MNLLLGVSCPSASDCWAVGWYTKHNGGYLNETLRWNGKKWSLVEAPHPAGTAVGDFNQLEAVTCTSKSSCWAVGDVVSPVENENEALQWNGKSWRRVATPQLPMDGNEPGSVDVLYSVACPSAADCWADGYSRDGSNPSGGMALRWNGRKWKTVSIPEPGSSSDSDAVACTSASGCWAVGDYTKSTGATLNEVLRWHAKIWTEVSAPEPGRRASTDVNDLFWDTCVSSSDCWAVGYVVNASGDTLNQALQWNGKKWSSR